MPLIQSDDKEQVDAWKEGIAFKAVWLLSVFPPRIFRSRVVGTISKHAMSEVAESWSSDFGQVDVGSVFAWLCNGLTVVSFSLPTCLVIGLLQKP